jgi:hypothetical protein
MQLADKIQRSKYLNPIFMTNPEAQKFRQDNLHLTGQLYVQKNSLKEFELISINVKQRSQEYYEAACTLRPVITTLIDPSNTEPLIDIINEKNYRRL